MVGTQKGSILDQSDKYPENFNGCSMSLLFVALNTTLAVLNCQKCPYFSPVLLRRGPQWAHDLYFRINETLCYVGLPGAVFSEKYLLAWSYDPLTSFNNERICADFMRVGEEGERGKSPERPPVFSASSPVPPFPDAELFFPAAKSEGKAAQYSSG